jgi:hypothetical protein
MGRMQAEEMRDRMSLDQALSWHLQSNHYPPVPLSMLPICVAAIEATNDGDYKRLILLPDGVTFHGSDQAPANEIVRQHHLDSFLENEDA